MAPAAIEIEDVLDRLVREHETTPPVDDRRHGPADLIALYSRIGSATLFDGRWRLLPARDRQLVDDDFTEWFTETLIDLDDGRSIAAVVDLVTQATYWVVCRLAAIESPRPYGPRFRLAEDLADIPVLGTSLALLLDAAMDAGGDIAHLETGRLDQLPTA
ncbi:hypothetical protein [Dactylosporangium cerinum]